MLSAKDIKDAIAKGSLKIDPFCESYLRPAGFILHLGSELLRPLPGRVVDVKKKIIPEYEKIIIEDDKPYELKPGDFLLGHTNESVTVGEQLGFMIEGRSTLARVGLTIVQTAMLVYPGHSDRPITLEFANHGVNSILLYPRMKIARAVVFELSSPETKRYDDSGKYRNQKSVGIPIFEKEIE